MRYGGACLLLWVGLGLAPGCVSPTDAGPDYDFFVPPHTDDAWILKIREWQEREREQRTADVGAASIRAASGGAERPRPMSVTTARRSGRLEAKFDAYQADERRALARRLNTWAQAEAREHYRFDPRTSFADDHWPTVQELFDRNGDDCDGLDLITYQQLHDFGFPREDVYRAVVRRQADGAHHMITLWFEDPVDPWVLVARGAMSLKMRHFSKLPGWLPTRVFSETEVYNVRERPRARGALADN
jgi:predicted transglutaminase-like cysteine proteinase